MNVMIESNTCARNAGVHCADCGQCVARHLRNSFAYSRCTQALSRLASLSVETWPQNAVQNAHSWKRDSSIGSASVRTASRSGPWLPASFKRASMRSRLSRSAASRMSCFDEK